MKKGFTLAEVLITLVIIGVVSALTVPVLMQNTQKQEYVSALKKAYSVLSQVTNQIIAEEGSPRGDSGGWADSVDNVYNLYKKHLSNAKECGAAEGCFPQKNVRWLAGGLEYNDNRDDSRYRNLILADGMQLGFLWLSPSCQFTPSGDVNAGGCFGIMIDVNGPKQPNTIGRDIFGVYVTESGGLKPNGSTTDGSSCNKNNHGWGCTYKVLTEGAMNY